MSGLYIQRSFNCKLIFFQLLASDIMFYFLNLESSIKLLFITKYIKMSRNNTQKMSQTNSQKQKQSCISHKKLPSIVPASQLQNSKTDNSQSINHIKKASNPQNDNKVRFIEPLQKRKQNISMTRKYLNHVKSYAQKQIDSTQNYLLQTIRKLQHSTKNLNNFHKKKQSFKTSKQNIQFALINKQLKITKQKLKNKNGKSLNYGDKLGNCSQTNQNKGHQTCKNIKQLYKKQKIQQEYEHQSRPQTKEFQQKLLLIKKILNEQQFNDFKLQLQTKIIQLKDKYKNNQSLKTKIIKYFSSYSVLQKFLEQIIKDSTKLILKQQNLELYYKIKTSMVSLLSNQQYFLKHINQIQTLQCQRQQSLLTKTLHNQQKFIMKTNKTMKGNKLYTNIDGNEDTLLERIQDLLQISKNNIKQAFMNFNKPHLMYQIQLQFNKRFKNLNHQIMSDQLK